MSDAVVFSMFLMIMVMSIICFFVWSAGRHRGFAELLREDLEVVYDKIDVLEKHNTALKEENAALKRRLNEKENHVLRIRRHLQVSSEEEKAAKSELEKYKRQPNTYIPLQD